MKPKLTSFKTRIFSNFLVFFGLLMAVSCRNWQSSFGPTETPVLLENRNIVSSTLNLTEIWRFRTDAPTTRINGIQTPPFIFIAKDKAIVGSKSDRHQKADGYLTALSMSSGEIIWKTTYSDPDYGVYIDSAYLNNNMNSLFLAYSFRVARFDLETGQQLWITPSLGGHTNYIFAYEQGNTLIVDSSQPERITIDPATGQVLSKVATDHQRMTIFHENIRLYNDNNGFNAADENNQTIWTWYDRGRGAIFWPSFIDENDLIAEFGGPSYYLARINYHTGQKVWQSAFYIMSNYALFENRVFALTEDGALIALNLQDGHVIGQIQFDKRIRKGNSATRPFLVAVSDPYLFTYFGDTQELIAFRFTTK